MDQEEVYFSFNDCYQPATTSLVVVLVEVQLTGGRTPFEGRVEVRRDGDNSWRYMCGTGAGWNLTVARAVCKQLGYFTVMWEWSNSEFGRSDLQSSVCDVRCPIMSESLEDCTIDWDNNGHDCQCHDNYHVGIMCYYPGFLGRYKESPDRIFPLPTSLSIPRSDVTIQGCIGACRDRGKTIAALTSGDECYCGDDSVDYWRYGEAIPGLPILNVTQAVKYNTHKCSGDNGTSPYVQGCGGDWQFDVYNTSFGACGGDYTDSSGYIYSPNFPGNYTNEQSCTWTITVDPGHIVKLTTLMLRLQDNDMVIVKDGIEDHSSTISTFTGYSLPQPLNSSSNTLRIEMITDNKGNDLGFVLQYKAINSTVEPSTALCTSSELSTGNGNTPEHVTLLSKSTESATSPETGDHVNTTAPLKDMYMYIGIGGGMFILLALVVIIVIVILLRRKQRTKKQTTEEQKPISTPDLIRRSRSSESGDPDITPHAHESDANAAFINENDRPKSISHNRESIDGERHKLEEMTMKVFPTDYEVLGPANNEEPVRPQSIDKTPELDDSYAQIDLPKKRNSENVTIGLGNEAESKAGQTDGHLYDNMQTEDATVDDRESEGVPTVPRRSLLRLEDSDDVGQMYAQVDKSKKKGRTNETGFVDSVLYESMSDTEPSQNDGYADNIVYESANMV
ncbi:uncharacterized protein [Ptychodera flava]|uniref:uncharacterized protein n=1 Tax=Ptychodera flava TaxID=63121 RepID=UPI00396A4C56